MLGPTSSTSAATVYNYILNNVYVVVNFLSQVIFVSLLFLGMLMYANEVETKEKEKLPETKNLLQHIY